MTRLHVHRALYFNACVPFPASDSIFSVALVRTVAASDASDQRGSPECISVFVTDFQVELRQARPLCAMRSVIS